jgi:DNA primase small subunit
MQKENRILETRIWLKRRFEDYYSKLDEMYTPENVHQREFGFGSFSKKIAVRHRAFKDKGELLGYIRKEAPAHVNHSTARYEFPGTEGSMEDKQRLGTDLIFDIDVGDLELKHDHEEGWVCNECFSALKGEVLKLKDFLMNDFGFAENETSINFSGSRGYHLRIRNDRILDLGENARKEICSYLSLDMDINELIFERGGMILGPKPSQNGLKGRIARATILGLETEDIPDKNRVIAQIKEGNWGAFPKGYGFKRITEFAKRAALKIPVDSKVTTDLSHLIRLPDSLHGGSSLIARIVDNIEKFDPMKDCFVFDGGMVDVEIVKETPAFEARDQTFGPFKEGKVTLPVFLAAYLGAKERCVIIK